jgi:hypothetical protein
VPRVGARVVEGREQFAGEAVIADAGHGAFHARLGQSRRLRLMTRLRSESSASPIPFIH